MRLTTEALPDRTAVDSVSAEQAAALMLDGNIAALSVITPALPHIAKASQLITHAIKGSGTLHYTAAGSSGLLALADCCELAGTFGIWEKQVRIHMMGGIPVSAAMPGNVEDDIESARTVAAAATPKDGSPLYVLGVNMSEDIIKSYLLILVGFMAFFASYLDMTSD